MIGIVCCGALAGSGPVTRAPVPALNSRFRSPRRRAVDTYGRQLLAYRKALHLARLRRKDPRKPSGPLGPADLPAQQDAGAAISAAALAAPPALQATPGTRTGLLGVFDRRGHLVADGPKNLPATLKRRPESFAYGESLAVRTRICCVVAAGPIAQRTSRPSRITTVDAKAPGSKAVTSSLIVREPRVE
jgi:hypothetical protein